MNGIEKTLDGYLEKIKTSSGPGGYLQVKELAFILRTSEKKIRNDIERGRLGMFKMGPEESHCHIRIPVTEAIGYVLQFFTAKSDLPPIDESPLFTRIKRLGLCQTKET
jgi:hypothetical protein